MCIRDSLNFDRLYLRPSPFSIGFMNFAEHVERIGPDGRYSYVPKNVTITMVEAPNKPFYKLLAHELTNAFNRRGDRVLRVSNNSRESFPGEAKAVIRFDNALTRRDPREMFSRFPKTGDGKTDRRVICVVPSRLPEKDDGLTDFARRFMLRKAAQLPVIVEGRLSDAQIFPGARGAVASLEGNVGTFKFNPRRSEEFYEEIAGRLAFLITPEMLNTKVPISSNRLTLEAWAQRPAVQAIASASHDLAKVKLLWDVNLRAFGDMRQVYFVLRQMKQAGLGEGMMSALTSIDGYPSPVMAVTETGTSKTNVDPLKGNVVAVPGFTEEGIVHWILSGRLKGHPADLLERPSLQTVLDMADLLKSSHLRDRLGKTLRGSIENPPSIEAWENAAFYHAAALLQAGVVKTYEDFIRYLAKQFTKRSVLPVIPEGLEESANAAIHLHKFPEEDQPDESIRVVNVDMKEFGFPHNPPCGSFEAASLVFMGLFNSYQQFGPPQSRHEIRAVGLAGHGLFAWGYDGMDSLKRRVINELRVKSVPKY